MDSNLVMLDKSLNFQKNMASGLMNGSLGGEAGQRGQLAVAASENIVEPTAVAEATGKGMKLNVRV